MLLRMMRAIDSFLFFLSPQNETSYPTHHRYGLAYVHRKDSRLLSSITPAHIPIDYMFYMKLDERLDLSDSRHSIFQCALTQGISLCLCFSRS